MRDVKVETKAERTSRRNVDDPPRLRNGGRERVAHRRAQAVALRRAGATFEAIGRQLHTSAMQAHRDVHAALQELAAQRNVDTAELVALECERLDHAQLLATQRASKDGDPRAIIAIVRICERRAKLLGLDAVQRVELTGGLRSTVEHSSLSAMTDAELLAEMKRFEAALAPVPATMLEEPEPAPAPADDLATQYERVLAARMAGNGNGRPS